MVAVKRVLQTCFILLILLCCMISKRCCVVDARINIVLCMLKVYDTTALDAFVSVEAAYAAWSGVACLNAEWKYIGWFSGLATILQEAVGGVNHCNAQLCNDLVWPMGAGLPAGFCLEALCLCEASCAHVTLLPPSNPLPLVLVMDKMHKMSSSSSACAASGDCTTMSSAGVCAFAHCLMLLAAAILALRLAAAVVKLGALLSSMPCMSAMAACRASSSEARCLC